ncbi:MAG TPA: ATP-binding protein [Clostridia bacterium]|jgi:two-component system phosphate regulon sensor histidine kinase PhoR|nr:ATP-binding protein [Clostridia bacterium]HQC68882.1 ATP-binding protein [Clostridia bacterium]
MRRRVFISIFLTSLLTMILTFVLISWIMYNNTFDSIKREVKNESFYVSDALKTYDDDSPDMYSYLNKVGLNSSNRITYIKNNGTVLYDNLAQASDLDNHSDRPEVIEALQNGSGEITRYSDTLGESIYYYALKLGNGNILRIAATTKSILGIMIGSAIWIIIIFITFISLSVIIARLLTKSIVKPINTLDLDNPLSNKTYDELSPLLLRLDKQKTELMKNVQEMSKARINFAFISNNMSEGIVVFSEKGYITGANKSAKEILGISIQQFFMEGCRDLDYIKAVRSALDGKPMTTKFEKNGLVYQLSASPVKENPEKHAALMFITDITEKDQAEQRRKEFSGNVSHELKTPLTSISGYAELISKKIAKKEDVPRFAEMIHTEAIRLLQVIEDIMKLSRLDESDLEKEFEYVSLKKICSSVVNDLTPIAQHKNVAINTHLKDVYINGYAPILYEMLYNLIDNAIIYNNPKGHVDISLAKEEDEIILSVKDNGIGIPPEHQPRIFERFYRVDKSHSKDTGGTGLGLSIVKHAAALHKADIDLISAPGEGTTVMITFYDSDK